MALAAVENAVIKDAEVPLSDLENGIAFYTVTVSDGFTQWSVRKRYGTRFKYPHIKSTRGTRTRMDNRRQM